MRSVAPPAGFLYVLQSVARDVVLWGVQFTWCPVLCLFPEPSIGLVLIVTLDS